jgi:hypothetical protein
MIRFPMANRWSPIDLEFEFEPHSWFDPGCGAELHDAKVPVAKGYQVPFAQRIREEVESEPEP